MFPHVDDDFEFSNFVISCLLCRIFSPEPLLPQSLVFILYSDSISSLCDVITAAVFRLNSTIIIKVQFGKFIRRLQGFYENYNLNLWSVYKVDGCRLLREVWDYQQQNKCFGVFLVFRFQLLSSSGGFIFFLSFFLSDFV